MTLLDLAIYKMQENLIDEAVSVLNELIEEDKNHFEAYNLLGICFSMQGRHQDAILYTGLAIAINPTIGNFWSNRAEYYMTMHKYEHALSDFEKAIELKYTSEIIYYNMALSAKEVGDSEKASYYARLQGWKNEFNKRILTATYKLQMQIGDYLGASLNISEIINEVGDDSMSIIFDHAVCFYHMAIEELDDYYVQEKNESQLEIEYYSHSKENFDWAIERLNRLLDLDENASMAYALRAKCFSKMKLIELAKEDISKAISLDPLNLKFNEIREEIESQK